MKKSVLKWCILLLAISIYGCFDPEDYEQVVASDKNIWFISDNIPGVFADGVSSGTISVAITEKASVGRRTVVFKASSGAFKGGSGDSVVVEVSRDFKASAQLTSLRAGTVTVTAEILGLRADGERKIEFKKAFPNDITVHVDSFSVASDYKGEVSIAASLSAANNGKPSIGHEVSFNVVDALTNQTIGDFLNNQFTANTDENGIASIRFSPGVVKFKGYAIITAITNISDSQVKSNKTRIYIR